MHLNAPSQGGFELTFRRCSALSASGATSRSMSTEMDQSWRYGSRFSSESRGQVLHISMAFRKCTVHFISPTLKILGPNRTHKQPSALLLRPCSARCSRERWRLGCHLSKRSLLKTKTFKKIKSLENKPLITLRLMHPLSVGQIY